MKEGLTRAREWVIEVAVVSLKSSSTSSLSSTNKLSEDFEKAKSDA